MVQTKESPSPAASGKFDTDIVVIGGGPGGYVAAIRAAQLGAKVTVVEKSYLGGTCLNVGCIPSKVWIASAEAYQHVKHAAAFGVTVSGEVGYDFAKMQARKDKIVQTQRGGIGMLFKKNGVAHVEGTASFVDKNTIEVEKDGKKQRLKAKSFIIATGSAVIMPKIPGLEGGRDDGIWTSDDAVDAPHVPKTMTIIGGGVIGVEFAYVFNALGCEVTVVEMMPKLIPMMDEDLSTELGKLLTKQGVKVLTGHAVEKLSKKGKAWKVGVKSGGEAKELDAEVVLVAVGRRAYTDNLNLEKIGVKTSRTGITVDDTMRTNFDNIFAIGDVNGIIQLAHVASYQGQVAAENAVRGSQRIADHKAIPNCIYTVPEVASVGLTEGQAREHGYDVSVGKFAFRPLGKAMASTHQDGFVKVVAEKKYGEVLGVHMVGHGVTDMIHQAVVAIKLEATVDVMVDTIHAHPTMSEAVLEAYEDAIGHAIHKA